MAIAWQIGGINEFYRIFAFLSSVGSTLGLVNTAMFELHVCQNGDWRRLDTYEERGSAMSASIELENSGKFSGIKVFREAFDPDQMTTVKKLIHTWWEEIAKKAKQDKVEDNIERQKKFRRKIFKKREREKTSRKELIQNYIVLTCVSLGAGFIAGVIVVLFST